MTTAIDEIEITECSLGFQDCECIGSLRDPDDPDWMHHGLHTRSEMAIVRIYDQLMKKPARVREAVAEAVNDNKHQMRRIRQFGHYHDPKYIGDRENAKHNTISEFTTLADLLRQLASEIDDAVMHFEEGLDATEDK